MSSSIGRAFGPVCRGSGRVEFRLGELERTVLIPFLATLLRGGRVATEHLSTVLADQSLVNLRRNLLSNVRINGFGSNAACAIPDRRFEGTAVSAKLSTKSRTIKSLLEKSSNVKLGPLGNRVLGPEDVRSMLVS